MSGRAPGSTGHAHRPSIERTRLRPRSKPQLTDAPSGAGPSPRAASVVVPLLLLVAIALGDVVRMGYFADDFIFVDAARRHSLVQLLSGEHGIRPWYRPLARECFFALLVAAGRAGPALGHLLALAVVAFAADSLHRVLRARLGALAATVAVLLFVLHPLTRFLAGWLSGFQDLLAIALVLGALRWNQQGKHGRATACIALAPFAKEAGLVALPLLALQSLTSVAKRPARRVWITHALAAGAALLVHVIVRTTWAAVFAPPPTGAEPRSMMGEFIAALAPLTQPPGRASAWVPLMAMGGGALAYALTRSVAPERHERDRRALSGIAGALAISAAPAFVPPLLLHYPAHAHFLFPALPWVCALGGWVGTRVVPRRLLPAALALVAAVSVHQGAVRQVDLDTPEGWKVGALGWAEAQRIEARTRRLETDLLSEFPVPPESLAIVYLHVPAGSWIQTQDGPATRVVLDSPTLTAHFVREVPERLAEWGRRPVVAVAYDPMVRHGFVRVRPGDPLVLQLAVAAMLRAELEEARALSALATRLDPTGLFPRYVSAALALGADADTSALAALARSADTLVADSVGPRKSHAAAVRIALSGALDANAHRRAADVHAAGNLPMLEAFERMVAVALDSTSAADALRLGRLLANKAPDHARRAFLVASRGGAPDSIRELAAGELARLDTRSR